MYESTNESTYVVYLAEQEIRDAIAKALPNASGIEVLKPRDDALADRTTNVCFKLARELKKNPQELALELCKKLSKGGEFFSPPTPAGGYVNFFFTKKFYDESLSECLAEKEFGSSAQGKGKKIVLEYSQPNPGKPMHLGHIRSTILGDVAARILAFQSYEVVRINYLNDCGAHIAELITSLKKHGITKVKDEKELVQYYVKIKQEIDSNAELKKESQSVLEKISVEQDKAVFAELKKIREMSYTAFQRNYDALGVEFDEIVCESTLITDARKRVQECLDKKIAFVDETGVVVAELEKHGLPNTLLLRSNKAVLYLTSDLALADYKWQKYDFTQSVYFTASEQNLHFKQLFKLLELLGRPYVDKLKHIGFGLIELPEGKMSTRLGRVVLLEDVLNEVISNAKEELVPSAHRAEYTAAEKDEIARIVGVGSLKFGVLRVSAEKNIEFDLKKAVDFNGDTGAYVQYTSVRAKNILRKSGVKKIAIPKAATASLQAAEKKLLLATAEFPQVITHSSLQPHALCDFLLKYAALFNSFYDQCPVLTAGEEEKKQRLAIVRSALTVLENGLGLLGIKVPEKM